jgi:hypothetical protein
LEEGSGEVMAKVGQDKKGYKPGNRGEKLRLFYGNNFLLVIFLRPGKKSGGEGGIRTHGNLTATHALQACLIGHSSTSPLSLAERVGFEPTLRYNRRPLFESGTINHSDTSP